MIILGICQNFIYDKVCNNSNIFISENKILINPDLGAVKNYLDREGFVVGQSNVNAHKLSDLFYIL